ncbi:MAG: hypothetical protein NT136_04235 [Candidatus Moranbacteria bacterium]|nr:hypothetical protein [Candidatus Moranbacteria bacterium]
MKQDSILTLHRYYIWATTMKFHFEEELKKHNISKNKDITIEQMMYMSIWYGLLYVVAEGWKNLKLHDKVIDSLLQSKNINLLKRYRNGVFHFNKKYYNDKYLDFCKEKSSADWIRKLNLELGKYFFGIF